MNLQPINDNIIFRFKDEIKNGHFVDKIRETGLIVDLGGDHRRSSKFSRIGEVVSVGPNVKEDVCKPGDNIVIQSLMWTESFKYQGVDYWMTQPRCIMGKV